MLNATEKKRQLKMQKWLKPFQLKKKRLGQRKIRRLNYAVYRRLEKAQALYRRQVTLTTKYKKQCQRMREKKEISPSPLQTPRTRVRITLRKSAAKVRKRLLFGEVLVSQLQLRLSGCKSTRDKQLFSRVMAGNLLKKYKLLKLSSSLISPHSNRRYRNVSSLNYSRKKKCNALWHEVKTAVQSFFEEDTNSCMAPGKWCYHIQESEKAEKILVRLTWESAHEVSSIAQLLNIVFLILSSKAILGGSTESRNSWYMHVH